MPKFVEIMLALRYLRARRQEGMISITALFSLAGITLGVMTLVVVLSVMNGVRQEMIRSIIGLEGHVTVYANTPGGVADYEAVANMLTEKPGVAMAIPKIEGQIMASAHGVSMGAMVAGYRAQDLASKPLLVTHIEQGDVAAWQRGEGVLIGSRMAEKMGLSVGDSMTLISPEGRATIVGTVPRMKAYPVVGIFSVGMFAYDSGLIVLPFEEAQIYFKLQNAAGLLEIVLQDADQSAAFAQAVATEFGGDFRVYDWQRSNAQILGAVLVQRNVMFLILMLIIVVACFNIISSLIMLVREKNRDIAILRTMGMTRAAVQRVFIWCGMSVGVVGTFLGIFLGLLIAYNTEAIQQWLEHVTGQRLLVDGLYFLSHLPAKVDGSEVVMVAAMSVVLSFLATLYPSWRAASTQPTEVLRGTY